MPTSQIDDISANDLLDHMILICPPGSQRVRMVHIVNGYRDAFDGICGPNDVIGDEYSQDFKQGFFMCNLNPMTYGERTHEILGLMSLMLMTGDDS